MPAFPMSEFNKNLRLLAVINNPMKKAILLILGLTCFSFWSNAAGVSGPGKAKSLKKIENGVMIDAEHARMMILCYSSTTLRVRVVPKDFGDDFSYAVVQKPSGNFKTVTESTAGWELCTDSLSVTVSKATLATRVLNLKGQVLCEDFPSFPYTWQGTEVTCYKKLFPDEKFIGLGE